MYVHSIALFLNFASGASGELKLTINSIKQSFNYTFQLRTSRGIPGHLGDSDWSKAFVIRIRLADGRRKAAKDVYSSAEKVDPNRELINTRNFFLLFKAI